MTSVRTGRQLSSAQRLVYASGYFGVGLAPAAAASYLGHYYFGRQDAAGLPLVLVSAAAFGVIRFVSEALNLATEPIVGYLSDGTRSRWGRRRPWIVIGAPLWALSFFLLWRPLGQSAALHAAQLLLASTACSFFFGMVVAPYTALLPEITPYDDERVRVSLLQGLIGEVGGACAAQAMPLLATALGGTLLFGCADGWQAAALILAGAVLAPTLLAGAATRTPPAPAPPPRTRAGLRQMLRGFGDVFRDAAFRPLAVGILIYYTAVTIVLFIVPFVATGILASYPLGAADRALLAGLPGGLDRAGAPDWPAVAGYLTMLVILGAVLCFPLIERLARRTGKRLLFLVALVWFGVSMALIGSVGLAPVLSPLTQAALYFASAAFPVGVAMVIIRPILADVIDLAAAREGRRREGTYVGVFGLLLRLGSAIAPLLASSLFALLGSTADRNAGVRSCGFAAALLLLAAARAFARYPIRK